MPATAQKVPPAITAPSTQKKTEGSVNRFFCELAPFPSSLRFSSLLACLLRCRGWHFTRLLLCPLGRFRSFLTSAAQRPPQAYCLGGRLGGQPSARFFHIFVLRT